MTEGQNSVKLGDSKSEISPNRSTDQSEVFSADVCPGRVYELRLVLQHLNSESSQSGLSRQEMNVTFLDTEGSEVDPRLANENSVVPHLDPISVEALPVGDVSDSLHAAAEASRFMLAPPDASRVTVSGLPKEINVLRVQLRPLTLVWLGREIRQFREAQQNLARLRRKIVIRELPLDSKSRTLFDELAEIPEAQISAISEHFQPGGDWQPVLDSLASRGQQSDYRLRMERLLRQSHRPPRVGFIGTERGRERLAGICEVFWLREDSLADQLMMLELDLVIVETSNRSGAGAEDADWFLAFASLDGSLPEKGATLFNSAVKAQLPVHLWITGALSSSTFWREAAARATRVVSEVSASALENVTVDQVVTQATEPAACSPAASFQRPPDLMLAPTASDLFHSSDFAQLVDESTVYRSLLTEFRYRFNPPALYRVLTNQSAEVLHENTRASQRTLLQAATIVVLPSQSLRSDQELCEIAMDAISSGAIPLLYGRPRGDAPLLAKLDQVFSSADLAELEALYRTTWLRERRWRNLWSYVMAEHVWDHASRLALLGGDTSSKDIDYPRITAVISTKRPHLIQDCIDCFRRQTWKNKELIIVLNTDSAPANLPELNEHEHIFMSPEAVNIGECLNLAIAQAQGRYWAKMDDDDWYSADYLKEAVRYFRSTQADVVGGQSAYFYFKDENVTRSRESVASHCRYILTRGHIAGATMCGDLEANNPPFSIADRNGADSNWVTRAINSGSRVFSGGCTSLVVYRSQDDKQHTWKINNAPSFYNAFRDRAKCNLFDRLDRG